jgi:hypothetical protein
VEVVCVSPVVTAGPTARYGNMGHERTTRARLAASTRFVGLVSEHLSEFRLILLSFLQTNLT